MSALPEGFGFYYGWVDGERVRVDLLPPKHLWRGDIELDTQKPDGNEEKGGVLRRQPSGRWSVCRPGRPP